MVLLPGDGSPYDSRILMWGPLGHGAEVGWNDGAVGCGTFPYTLPVLSATWTPEVDIHCAGHAQLANGELLSAGGEDLGAFWGIDDSRTFQTGTLGSAGTWTGPPSRPLMQQARFYPSVTTLSDGRAVVTGGYRDEQAWFFGGRVDGNPPGTGVGDSLFRHARSSGGRWDPLVRPLATAAQAERPTPREGLTSVYLSDLSADVYFGGRDGAGAPINEQGSAWLLRRQDGQTLDADYKYQWDKLVLAAGSPIPAPRSEHTAIAVSATEMIVFGGTSTAGQELWRLYKDSFDQKWRWQAVTVTGTSGTGPTARFGHAAVYQQSDHRMIVFGGSDVLGGTPTDSRLFAFTFPSNTDFTQGSWSEILVAAGPAPESRRDHIMVVKDDDIAPEPGGPFLFVYGGHLGSGTSEATLWKLRLGTSPLPAWTQVTASGASPGPRANHAAFFDNRFGNGRLFIFGGEPAPSASVDKFVYAIEPFPISGAPTWVRAGEAPYRLSGHTAGGDPGGGMHARLPETYNRTANTWTTQSNSGWLLPPQTSALYPVQFLTPGSPLAGGAGRLIRVGPDPIGRYLDIPASGLASGWQSFANNDNGTFHPHTGVMYEPGKILVVGDEVTNAEIAKTFDADSIGTAGWLTREGVRRSRYLNLVILPNGQVLALGGLRTDGTAQKCPQLWTPSTGLWTSADTCDLEPDVINRNYHSTAILLPDGRVMTGGGSETGTEAQLKVFCPPYLFDGSGQPATRPQITSAPTSITYGEAFIIGKQVSDVIASACLIRPAATTHAFDQNQRFVPLAIETLPDGSGLRVVAPPRGSSAPPGYYLLFVINQNGVPAVAHWVQLGNCPTVPCDTGPPPKVNDLYVDIVGPTEIWLDWSAPGDDISPLSGSFDLRFASSSITTENAYAAATSVPVSSPDQNEPPVATAGYPMSYAKFNLAPCTQYSFALKTLDGANNWSPLSNQVSVSTTCDGGGGTFSAHRVGGEAADAPGAPLAAGAADATTASADSLPVTATLVTQTRLLASGAWQVSLHYATETDGLDPAATAVTVDRQDASGNRETVGQFTPEAATSLLGVCSLRERGRTAIPGVYQLAQVMPHLRSRSQDFVLTAAQHSRLGSLGERFVASGGGVDLAAGETLDLTYEPAGDTLSDAASWYLLVRRVGRASPYQFSQRPTADLALPDHFALRQNEPNPTGEATVLRFDLPVPSPVRLEVFDLLGRRVATLAQGNYPAGFHAVAWDLHDAGGSAVRPGVYVYRLVAGDFRARRKMSVLP